MRGLAAGLVGLIVVVGDQGASLAVTSCEGLSSLVQSISHDHTRRIGFNGRTDVAGRIWGGPWILQSARLLPRRGDSDAVV